jgi:ubiquinone/menaquinone biosynthesis C-methylase UbiE
MKVLDVGPGMGYFTVPMAKLVGTEGEVIAADLQQQMLDGVDSRAFRAGVQERVKLHLVKAESLNIPEPIDFCLAFWMVHEVPDRAHLLNEISESLKKDGLFLMVEPRIHVSKANFSAAVRMAENAGLSLISRPKIFLSYSALLKK